MAEPFDPAPIVALLDRAVELFTKSPDTRSDHADAFATRIAQAKALCGESAHHHNNVLPYVPEEGKTAEETIAELRAQLATTTSAKKKEA